MLVQGVLARHGFVLNQGIALAVRSMLFAKQAHHGQVRMPANRDRASDKSIKRKSRLPGPFSKNMRL
jgi:hypothetical protein